MILKFWKIDGYSRKYVKIIRLHIALKFSVLEDITCIKMGELQNSSIKKYN